MPPPPRYACSHDLVIIIIGRTLKHFHFICAVQCSAHILVRCGALRWVMVRCIGMQNSLGRCSAMRCGAVRRATLRCVALRCIFFCGEKHYGGVRCGAV